MLNRTLSDLQSRAGLALAHDELVEVAKTLSPSAAYEQALALRFNEAAAKSCRFLAIIRRDYGNDGIQRSAESKRDADLNRILCEEVIPGLQALEVIGGGKLRIVGPEDRGLTLGEYLEQSKCDSLNIDLALGEYCISFLWQVHKTTCGSYEIRERVKVTCSRGVLLDESCDCSRGETKHPGQRELRSRLYDALMQYFVHGSWRTKSVAVVILEDLGKQGVKLAPRLYEVTGISESVKLGNVESLKLIATSVREEVINGGVGERGVKFFDLEVELALSQAERKQRSLDPNITLLEKIHEGLFCVGHRIVSGPKAEKVYTFLINVDGVLDVDAWVRLLQKCGYGGSLVVVYDNIPSGMQVAGTGQCDAFLLRQYGTRNKRDILDQAQAAMEKMQVALGREVRQVPKFFCDSGYSDATMGGADKFLAEHFPLK